MAGIGRPRPSGVIVMRASSLGRCATGGAPNGRARAATAGALAPPGMARAVRSSARPRCRWPAAPPLAVTLLAITLGVISVTAVPLIVASLRVAEAG